MAATDSGTRVLICCGPTCAEAGRGDHPYSGDADQGDPGSLHRVSRCDFFRYTSIHPFCLHEWVGSLGNLFHFPLLNDSGQSAMAVWPVEKCDKITASAGRIDAYVFAFCVLSDVSRGFVAGFDDGRNHQDFPDVVRDGGAADLGDVSISGEN